MINDTISGSWVGVIQHNAEDCHNKNMADSTKWKKASIIADKLLDIL